MWYFYKESIFNEEIVTKRFYNFHGLATMRTMNIQKDTISQHLSFKKGDYIFKKGDMRDHAFIIIDGSVAIITQSHTGAESIGSMLSAGDIFGEMALMEPGVRTAAARATADTDVYAISRAGVKERISGMDPIISTLFSLLIDRYRKTRIYLPESADLPDPEHVIQHLRNLAQLEKDIEAVAVVAKKFEIIILKELTKMFEERIYLSHENYKKISLKAVKGELVLAVNIISTSKKQQELSLEYISQIVSEMGVKKAYQVVKTKYKISRNKFYEMAINLNNE